MLKPPKATPKPYTRHILGIDSGVRSHPKATPKPTDSQPIGNPKPLQSHPKAPPRLHQSHTKAPPEPHQGSTRATPKPHQSPTKATHSSRKPPTRGVNNYCGSSRLKPGLHTARSPGFSRHAQSIMTSRIIRPVQNLGLAETTGFARGLAMMGIAEASPFPAWSIIPARKSNGISAGRWHSPSGSSDETSNASSDLRAGSGAAGRWLSVPQRGQELQQRRWPQLLLA